MWKTENPTIDLAIEYIEVYDRANGVQTHVSELCWVKELKQPQIAESHHFRVFLRLTIQNITGGRFVIFWNSIQKMDSDKLYLGPWISGHIWALTHLGPWPPGSTSGLLWVGRAHHQNRKAMWTQRALDVHYSIAVGFFNLFSCLFYLPNESRKYDIIRKYR